MNNVGMAERRVLERLRQFRESIELSPLEESFLLEVETMFEAVIRHKNAMMKRDTILRIEHPEVHAEVTKAYRALYKDYQRDE